MPEIGQTISHFRIEEKIGVGGMGEVCLADDTTLDRKVALKFLPDAFTSDPERMARFEREAKLLASLNHPNIAGIYGLEQADGNRFLVLEYVEGETLQERLSKGALPLENALELCRQIAEGLEAAHEKGVIHRDLKPANVMITAEEKVKILDFGLAKALSDETQSIDSSQSPTLTEAMTQPGIILGTAAYMSLEQAKGKNVDKRADIWAFGGILYECLTGRKAFEGETVTETLAAVIKESPDLERASSKTRLLLRRCLEKDPKKRLRDIAEAMVWIEASPESAFESVPIKQSRLVWTWAIFATILLLAAAIPAVLYFKGQKPVEAFRYNLSVPRMPDDYSMAISPDGHHITYASLTDDSAVSLFVCDVGSINPKQLEGTEGASYPFWSPDSRSIGFHAKGRLKIIDISGGPPRDICATRESTSGTWNKEDVIIFSDLNGKEMCRVSAKKRGESTIILTPDPSQDEVFIADPCFLPDGRHFLYQVLFNNPSDNGVYLGSLDSDIRKRILDGVTKTVYVEPGYILFHRMGALYALPFDVKDLSIEGEAVRLNDISVVYSYKTSKTSFSASDNGVLIYLSRAKQIQSQFVWLDRDGNKLGVAGKPGMYSPQFDLSPEGNKVAMVQHDSGTAGMVIDIVLIDFETHMQEPFTSEASADGNAHWSPDGLKIAFSSYRNEGSDLFVKKVGAMSGEEILLESPDSIRMGSWSKDGKYIAYINETPPRQDIYILELTEEKKNYPIIQSPGIQWDPRFSPDGKWLAYRSNENGKWEIFVISFPDAENRRKVSNNGGVQPLWGKDGRELYYLSLDGKLMAVDIEVETGITSGRPHMLFDTKLPVKTEDYQYDITTDGKRFLFLMPVIETTRPPITVLINWTKLLE
jgi:serine/threonine protein kinase